MGNASSQDADAFDRALHSRRLGQVYRRDPQAEGQFWYSVVTTGVYCRPACPSRHARPENIRFHDTLADARRTGFRSCRRCQPDEPPAGDRHRRMIAHACRLIETQAEPLSSHALAAALGVSPSHLHRLFKRTMGTTPAAYARARRTAGAADAPASSQDSGTESVRPLARGGVYPGEPRRGGSEAQMDIPKSDTTAPAVVSGAAC